MFLRCEMEVDETHTVASHHLQVDSECVHIGRNTVEGDPREDDDQAWVCTIIIIIIIKMCAEIQPGAAWMRITLRK